MKKELFQTIEIPEGVEVSIDGNFLKIKGPQGENVRELKIGRLNIEVKDKNIVIGNKISTKMEKKLLNTFTAHIKNMIKGVQEKFEYTLKVCHSHFPMTVTVEGNKAKVKNFLGEKIERSCKIPTGAEVEVKGDMITIKSTDKEIAGQAAANFEASTKIRKRDRRIFQDGIYILNKAGREL